MLLEEADPFPGQYVIEVSSPGIRRPLRKIEHYQAAVGSRVDLKVMGPGARRVRGVLQEVRGDQLVVLPDAAGPTEGEPSPEAPAEMTVAFRKILEGNLDPEFDAQALINADRRSAPGALRDRRQAARAVRAARRSRGTIPPTRKPNRKPEPGPRVRPRAGAETAWTTISSMP